jgi:hypothetical protein
VHNVPIVAERRGRVHESDTALFPRNLSRLPIAVDRAPEEAAVLTLARRHCLTVYDASYLELAQRHGVAFATLGAALAKRRSGRVLRGSASEPRDRLRSAAERFAGQLGHPSLRAPRQRHIMRR